MLQLAAVFTLVFGMGGNTLTSRKLRSWLIKSRLNQQLLASLIWRIPSLSPKTRRDAAVANQQETAPTGITLAPSLPVRDPLPRRDHHYGPAPPRDNRNQVSRRPSERQSHAVSYEINYPPHRKARHDEISGSDLPQIRVHHDVRPSRSIQPPLAEQALPPRGHGMRPAMQTWPQFLPHHSMHLWHVLLLLANAPSSPSPSHSSNGPAIYSTTPSCQQGFRKNCKRPS